VRRIKKAGTVTGVGFGVIFGATALLLPFLFSDTTNEVRAMASAGILCMRSLRSSRSAT
jgi:hypothetical protein